jgi:transcription elongation factor Elf1
MTLLEGMEPVWTCPGCGHPLDQETAVDVETPIRTIAMCPHCAPDSQTEVGSR